MEGWLEVEEDSALIRLYTTHPNNIGCWRLCLFIQHIRFSTSYTYLKTIDNSQYLKFQFVCNTHGLLEEDKHWYFTLKENSSSQSAHEMWELFSIVLV